MSRRDDGRHRERLLHRLLHPGQPVQRRTVREPDDRGRVYVARRLLERVHGYELHVHREWLYLREFELRAVRELDALSITSQRDPKAPVSDAS